MVLAKQVIGLVGADAALDACGGFAADHQGAWLQCIAGCNCARTPVAIDKAGDDHQLAADQPGRQKAVLAPPQGDGHANRRLMQWQHPHRPVGAQAFEGDGVSETVEQMVAVQQQLIVVHGVLGRFDRITDCQIHQGLGCQAPTHQHARKTQLKRFDGEPALSELVDHLPGQGPQQQQRRAGHHQARECHQAFKRQKGRTDPAMHQGRLHLPPRQGGIGNRQQRFVQWLQLQSQFQKVEDLVASVVGVVNAERTRQGVDPKPQQPVAAGQDQAAVVAQQGRGDQLCLTHPQATGQITGDLPVRDGTVGLRCEAGEGHGAQRLNPW